MTDFHLDDAALDELLRLNDHRLQKDTLLHLLSTCPECGRVGAYLLEAARAGRLPRDYSMLEAELERSRAQAPELWERMAQLPFERQRHLVREADRLQPGEPAEEEWLLGVRALAFAHLGNARRVLGELRSADEAFARAAELWERSEKETGDPLGYGPVILDLEASLRRDQRRFEEALDLLDRVVTAYRDGDPERRDLHLAGRALINKAYTCDQMNDPSRALEVLREAAPLVHPARDPRLVLCLRHNVVWSLTTLGRHQEARKLLPEVETLSRENRQCSRSGAVAVGGSADRRRVRGDGPGGGGVPGGAACVPRSGDRL